MIPQPPPGQDPIDPRGAFSPPPPPGVPPQSAPGSSNPSSPGGTNWPQAAGFPPTGPQSSAAPEQSSGGQQGAAPPAPQQPPPGMGVPPGQGGYPPPPGYPPGPGYPAPFMMMPPPGFFKPRRSGLRTFFTIFGSIVLVVSIILNLVLFLLGRSGLGLSSQGITTSVVIDGDSHQKIAVIPINGLINDAAAERFNAMMAMVEKDSSIKAVVLDIDTPGGTVTASDEIYHRVQGFKQRNADEKKNIPVIATMGGFATSGGYYVSCSADYIYAQRTTITGNIGVIWPRMNFSKLANSYGVEEETITAPAKGFKNAGSSMHSLTDEEREYLQGLLNQAFATFKKAITDGRPQLKSTIDQIADGKALTAPEAMNLGLIDKIGYATDAYAYAAGQAKISNYQVVRYSKPVTFLDLLSGQAEGRMSGAGAQVSAGGVNVKLDASLLDELNRPRILYLWRGQ